MRCWSCPRGSSGVTVISPARRTHSTPSTRCYPTAEQVRRKANRITPRLRESSSTVHGIVRLRVGPHFVACSSVNCDESRPRCSRIIAIVALQETYPPALPLPLHLSLSTTNTNRFVLPFYLSKIMFAIEMRLSNLCYLRSSPEAFRAVRTRRKNVPFRCMQFSFDS